MRSTVKNEELLDCRPDSTGWVRCARTPAIRKSPVSRNEVLTEMTNIVGAALLGVTLGCARCHDHKFDPIRHTDYYRMQAFFAPTHDNDIDNASPEEKAAWRGRRRRRAARCARCANRCAG